MAERRLVVIGGGITGLTAAHAALGRAQELQAPVQITVLERSPRFGGNLLTEHVDGFLLDRGGDSWVTSKPQATALARELGLDREIIGTYHGARRYYIVWKGQLRAVPDGFILGVPTRLGPLLRTPFFSWWGKLRVALEPWVPARRFRDDDDDESIADFATRRLGSEASERLVAPLLGGISAADPGTISIRAAFPQLVTMERDYGSLIRGVRAAQRARAASPAGNETGAFVTLQGGVGELVRALVAQLGAAGVALRSEVGAEALLREGERWVVVLPGGEKIAADAVLLAVPAHPAARLLGALDASLAADLTGIPYSSTATVFVACKRGDVTHPLDGVGFVVPRAASRPSLAGTWVSSKWAGRAPEGHVLMRVFFGGADGRSVLAEDDEALAALARRELRELVGLKAEPLWSRVFRFDAARPVMRIGHLATMRGIHKRLAQIAPGLRLAGEGYDGAGIPDCVRQGREAGRALAEARP